MAAATNPLDRLIARAPMLGYTLNGARSGQALNSALSFRVSGNSVAFRFIAHAAVTLTDVEFFVSAITGTGGSVLVELRNYSSATVPGSTVHATATAVTTNAATKWYKANFATPFTLVAGTIYYVVIYNNTGIPISNYPTVLYRGNGPRTLESSNRYIIGLTTANGWSTGTEQNDPCACVLCFGDGSFLGNPFTNVAAYTSNQNERGWYIAGLTEDLVICGAQWSGGSANMSGLKIYKGSAAQGSAGELTVTFGTGVALLGACRFAPFTLRRLNIYHVVMTFSANDTGPSYAEIEDCTTYTADLTACAFLGGRMYATSGAAGIWVESVHRAPRLALIVHDQVAINRRPGGRGGLRVA